ncbi:sensor histidine kinase N-terminal domain-containing protein [Stappia taiwanensis]|uniref:histidine kinase n=1 Tax=Stappia taiwanensis TaxID=992267 RepID=A0A838XZ05_9HYPH|nr:ATP-binding protein [Stappia taiwanensis]MBA4613676.1 sensor histidine kinase N-terminal domain-containing protein [Stappia taiwanensis]GGE81495.1 two-component sensor histidine kinase [Stappia taiwanensis]
MTSLRARLLLILITGTAAVWLSAMAWIFLSTRAEVEEVLDARLMEAARMVNSLISERRQEPGGGLPPTDTLFGEFERQPRAYERQLSCQIWSLDGALVGRSESAPQMRLSTAEAGFSLSDIDGETWRVFTVANPELGVRVMVGDNLRIRDGLVGDVIKGMLLPTVLVLPVMIGLIWLSVRQGLSPLNTVAAHLASRRARDLRPVPDGKLPREVAPLVGALNGLFKRVEDARERERSFTAFAAHELKTPLAGLKTQAQIALASDDRQVHANALRQISSGVDRTARLVKQLLDLAALEANDAAPKLVEADPVPVVRSVISALEPLARSREVSLSVTVPDEPLRVTMEPHFLELALRNLVENAVLHAPSGGEASCELRRAPDGRVSLHVRDDGPGIAEAELPLATERFFRGSNRSALGSGLGLAIVELAMERMGGALRLVNRTPHGLDASLTFANRGEDTAR